MKTLILILLSAACLFTDEILYEFEGVFPDPTAKFTFSTLSLFLPYNPAILNLEPANEDRCETVWPRGHILTLDDDSTPIDFLWIGPDSNDLIHLTNLLRRANV